jgi:glutamine amidotransferase
VCELMGISCSNRVKPGRYFNAFRWRGDELPEGKGNPDGWGIALYPDGKAAQIIKEAIPASTSGLSKFLSAYDHLRSRLFIAHVRKASKGAVTYSNSHPFARVVRGRDYVFAHNGTIRTFRGLRLGRFKPIGTTDSELLFCHLLKLIQERRISGWIDEDFLELRGFFVALNRLCAKKGGKPNKLNVLLSDGETLIAYTDLYGRGTLHRLLLRKQVERLGVENISSECHSITDGSGKSLAVIATVPLPHNKRWVEMEAGELCAFRDGALVFSSCKVSP